MRRDHDGADRLPSRSSGVASMVRTPEAACTGGVTVLGIFRLGAADVVDVDRLRDR